MKLLSVKVSNFLSHGSAEVDFGHVTIFNGINGSGKTALAQDAILFALTGDCGRDPIRKGEKSTEVILCVEINETPVTITRRKSNSSQTLKVESPKGVMEGTPAQVTEKVLAKLGLTPDMVAALVKTGEFASQDGSTRKDIFFRALGVTVNHESLREWLNQHYPDTDWEKVLKNLLNEFASMFEQNDRFNEGVFTERRKQAKREADRIGQEIDSLSPMTANPGDLDELAARRDKLLADLAEMSSTEQQRRALPTLRMELGQIEKILQAGGNGVTEKDWEALESAKVRVAEIIKEATPVKADRDKAAARKAIISQQLEDLKTVGAKCPTCGQAVTKTKLKARKDELESEYNTLVSDLADLNGQLDVLRVEKETLDKFIAAKEAAISKHKQTALSDDQKGQAEARKEELLQTIATLENIGDVTALKAQAQAQLNLVLAEIAKKENSSPERAESLRQELAKANQEIYINDALAKAFSDKGVRAWMLSTRLSEMNQIASELAGQIGYRNLEFSIKTVDRKETIAITVDGRDISQFSEAERLMLNAVVQMVLVKTAGFGVLVIDNFDHVRNPHYKWFQKMVLQSKDLFESVVIIKATNDGEELPPNLPDFMRRYVLEKGAALAA